MTYNFTNILYVHIITKNKELNNALQTGCIKISNHHFYSLMQHAYSSVQPFKVFNHDSKFSKDKTCGITRSAILLEAIYNITATIPHIEIVAYF